jgi:hypothetical protein
MKAGDGMMPEQQGLSRLSSYFLPVMHMKAAPEAASVRQASGDALVPS